MRIYSSRTDRAVLAVNGFAADGNMFVKKVKQRLEVSHNRSRSCISCELTVHQWYRHAHAKDMPLRAIARLIQTMLYAQRFFPYYVYNILGGIEEDGESHSILGTAYTRASRELVALVCYMTTASLSVPVVMYLVGYSPPCIARSS